MLYIYIHMLYKNNFYLNIYSLLHFVQNIYFIIFIYFYIYVQVYAIVFNGMYILRQLAHHIAFNCYKHGQTIPIVL